MQVQQVPSRGGFLAEDEHVPRQNANVEVIRLEQAHHRAVIFPAPGGHWRAFARHFATGSLAKVARAKCDEWEARSLYLRKKGVAVRVLTLGTVAKDHDYLGIETPITNRRKRGT
jgi:hypothetical protein